MKILAIQGSPRRNGNTQGVLDSVLTGAEANGACVETIKVASLSNVTGCLECYKCQNEIDKPGCDIDDEMMLVIEKAFAAELILWCTPVFCWSPAWPIKMAMDRLYCMFKFGDNGNIKSLLEGRRMAALITAGGSENDGADLVEQIFQRICSFADCHWAGTLIAPNLTTPDVVRGNQELSKRAITFGKELALS